ncbi:unnamed protein product [Moneuplotes crassus]|uniref:Uncharacterized protein n=1 Tax=Euplotes crassus TaxID=5936 RepID=A0AAD1XH42_EUPCR|nr:unnamed protein product [Moneuplotes crassus]
MDALQIYTVLKSDQLLLKMHKHDFGNTQCVIRRLCISISDNSGNLDVSSSPKLHYSKFQVRKLST